MNKQFQVIKPEYLFTDFQKDTSQSQVVFTWLLVLRWVSVICQVLLFLSVYILFDFKVPLLLVSTIVAFQVGTNLFFTWYKRKNEIGESLCMMVLMLDVLLLTVLIYNTGGAMNPFTFLYLVHVVLGAILTPTRWSWSLMLFTLFCYGSLFLPLNVWFHKLCLLLPNIIYTNTLVHFCGNSQMMKMHGENMNLHLQGMLVAFAITSFFIVFMVGKIQKALIKHQRIVNNLREEKENNERLASLTTFAAGAAHEFSTPLSTIAVASKEMVYALEKNGDSELTSDALLIRDQVEKCREILFDMSADAGEYMGEVAILVPLDSLVMDVVRECQEKVETEIVVNNSNHNLVICMPVNTLKRTLRELVRNSCDAIHDRSPVVINCSSDINFVYIDVQDNGEGMSSETVARAFDPFFTTKETGKGFGLGLYLAKTMAERFDGDLVLQSEPGKGTRAVLKLPKAEG